MKQVLSGSERFTATAPLLSRPQYERLLALAWRREREAGRRPVLNRGEVIGNTPPDGSGTGWDAEAEAEIQARQTSLAREPKAPSASGA